jgi:hypothetical protein
MKLELAPYQPLPSTNYSPTRILSSTGYTDSIGTEHIVGEVINQSPTTVQFVQVTVTFYDAYNQVIGTDFTFTHPDTLAPGQTAPFDILVPASEKAERDFVCDKIEATFDIKDIKTMLVHHSELGSFVNMSEKELDSVFGFVDGDTPRKFEDLNLKITDEKHKKLDIIALNTNKPTYKDFVIRLRKPLKPHERNRFIKIEWDWEEPYRHHNHKFLFECKYFKFSLIAPKELSLRQKVYRVDEATGVKQFADSPPTEKDCRQ